MRKNISEIARQNYAYGYGSGQAAQFLMLPRTFMKTFFAFLPFFGALASLISFNFIYLVGAV
jgi:hypothetical protein